MKSHFVTQYCRIDTWPHRLALLLVCATFPLIWVGGLVTTYDAGMAVPDWPNTYGYNLFLYPWSTWISGPWDLFIEHGHRLLAAGVGLLAIILLVVTLAAGTAPLGAMVGRRRSGAGGPAGRIGRGSRAVWTTCGWRGSTVGPGRCSSCGASPWRQSRRVGGSRRRRPLPGSVDRLRRPAWVALALATAQLLLGSHLRHLPSDWSPQAFRAVAVAHLVVATVLLAQALLLTVRCWRDAGLRNRPLLLRPATAISLLVVLQLVSGGGDLAGEVFLANLAAAAGLV